MMVVALGAVMDVASPCSRLTTPSLSINWPRVGEKRGFRVPLVPRKYQHPASCESGWVRGGELAEQYWQTLDPFVALTSAASATRELRLGTKSAWWWSLTPS